MKNIGSLFWYLNFNNFYYSIRSPPIAETAIVNATAPSPSIKLRITDKEGVDITGARLGDELYLRIELNDDSVFGIFARDLIAKSGKTDESIVLIDSHGCPTDVNIFPELEQVPGSKALQGKFDAFKFADDVVVRFQVNVQFCLQVKQVVILCYMTLTCHDIDLSKLSFLGLFTNGLWLATSSTVKHIQF